MSTFLKIILTSVIVLATGYIIYVTIDAAMGDYFLNASFINTGLICIGLVVLVYSAIRLIYKTWSASVVAILMLSTMFATSCNYAKSNQQVVVSEDCGKSWKEIEAGKSVPKQGVNPCYMKVVMPNYSMQGETKFVTNMSGRVRVNVHIDYDYSIITPLSFITEAKYLGKANTDADSDEALSSSAFEGAENIVIDKRIRDVAKRIFLKEDIVELDQAEVENILLEEVNQVLDPLGIKLNFITLTLDPDEQTRQAIDVATAMKIYESKGLSDLGKTVIAARAGATKISVSTEAEQKGQ